MATNENPDPNKPPEEKENNETVKSDIELLKSRWP